MKVINQYEPYIKGYSIYETRSPEETYELAFTLASKSKLGDIYLLNGELGVGKSVFAAGFAKGLGISDIISSPTFTIIKEYNLNSDNQLIHVDAYRINTDEALEIGLDELLESSNNISLVEWSSNIIDIFSNKTINIEIEKDLSKGDNYRLIKIENRKE